MNLQHLMWRCVDGLLIYVTAESDDYTHIQQLREQGIPIVFFDRVINDINTHQVIAENVKGSYDATSHLANAGYKKIAIVTSSPYLSITKQRTQGYEKALGDAGLPVVNDYIRYCEHGGMMMEEIESAVFIPFGINESFQ